jgi:hypothetical protein
MNHQGHQALRAQHHVTSNLTSPRTLVEIAKSNYTSIRVAIRLDTTERA